MNSPTVCLGIQKTRVQDAAKHYLVVSTTPVRENQTARTKINNCLGKQGGCAGSSFVEIKAAMPETLCKTITGFGSGHSVMIVPNVATANETRSRSVRLSA